MNSQFSSWKVPKVDHHCHPRLAFPTPILRLHRTTAEGLGLSEEPPPFPINQSPTLGQPHYSVFLMLLRSTIHGIDALQLTPGMKECVSVPVTFNVHTRPIAMIANPTK